MAPPPQLPEPAEAFAARAVPSSTTFKPNILAGKVVFCTGGGSGICYRIVEVLLAHGATAAIMGRKADRLSAAAKQLSESTRRKCIATPGDVRKYDDVEKAVDATVKEFGRLDMVVCGAAGNFLAPIEGISPNGFKTVQEIDLLGTYHTVKATLEHLKRSHGSYVHISATLHYTAIPWQAAPSAAKAGVDALSNSIAVEFGPFGIRSNCIAPGMIQGTEGADRLTPKGAEDLVVSRIPTQRMGQKDDIANAALFLFSDAGNYINGTQIVVDGGAKHFPGPWLPYPDSSLDKQGVKELVMGSKL
ncbi:NAD(P)-binding protein [Jaminaea rosea]|uniref:2,4-dienoyl-CoA reductase [(3E)-enoyl-CoA-producing] n=1 Tax=Jaminaea rosea TaxID=1569628 RepID=A0A316UJ62_9BASI|nr:NAD(P)-binding protein [Jaminaea rosea]PWN25337.1 NAD(P)-binding protein [Jaminaea rosea]